MFEKKIRSAVSNRETTPASSQTKQPETSADRRPHVDLTLASGPSIQRSNNVDNTNFLRGITKRLAESDTILPALVGGALGLGTGIAMRAAFGIGLPYVADSALFGVVASTFSFDGGGFSVKAPLKQWVNDVSNRMFRISLKNIEWPVVPPLAVGACSFGAAALISNPLLGGIAASVGIASTLFASPVLIRTALAVTISAITLPMALVSSVSQGISKPLNWLAKKLDSYLSRMTAGIQQ